MSELVSTVRQKATGLLLGLEAESETNGRSARNMGARVGATLRGKIESVRD